MTVQELIHELINMQALHGKTARVLINHSDPAKPYFIPAEDGCPGYVSVESE